MFSFSALNLGCSKNLVDLEFAIGEILKYADTVPMEYFDTPEDPEVEYVIVNTCGFLSSAREESEATLQYYDDLGKKLILMGCYISVKDDAFLASLKHLFMIVPFMSYSVIEEILLGKKSKFNLSALVGAKQAQKQSKEKTLHTYLSALWGDHRTKKAFVWKWDEVRAYIHAPYRYEYLKIAEGCDNTCTFCIIPRIRGRQNSRKKEDILREVQTLFENGICEIEIISQDTTRYGVDIYGSSELFTLLEAIESECERYETKHPWSRVRYRVFYLYPDTLTMEHLEKMSALRHLLPYFDIPFQHASEKILKLMGRHYDRSHIDTLLEKVRNTFSDAFIRTSFIIGFPWETENDFQELMDFVKKNRFESVGIFQYHDEPLAASSKLGNKIEDRIAKDRIARINTLLNGIYEEHAIASRGMISWGYIMEVWDLKKDYTIRREIAAPEIDEYDRVRRWAIDKKGTVSIGEYVMYTLP